MTVLEGVLAAYCAGALFLHATTAALAWLRCRCARRVPAAPLDRTAAVTLIRPVCGLESSERVTLASTFDVAWPGLEIIFCAASRKDPAVPFLSRLIAQAKGCNARVLIGDMHETANPKLNNLIKGWEAASGTWIVLADSNLLLPCDYIDRLLARFTSGTGLVCAPPIASAPRGFWAEVEAAFLNTYQARWQYAADTIGFGFAQGKSMLWRRADLDRHGGIAALGIELAEDAAATKLVRAEGRKVRLAGPSFEQPIGERSAAQVIGRQTRWAQLRRLTFPSFFVPEVLTGGLLPALAGALAGDLAGLPPVAAGIAVLTLFLAVEAMLAHAARWPLGWRSPLAWLVRDLLIPVVWLRAFTAGGYEWRGNRISVGDAGTAEMKPSTA